MQELFILECTRYFIMKKIRSKISNYFISWKYWKTKKGKRNQYEIYKINKDIDDLICNLLFFRTTDPFFPIIDESDIWIGPCLNKLKYMSELYDNTFEEEIKFIRETFFEAHGEFDKYRGICIRDIQNREINIYLKNLDNNKVSLKNNIYWDISFILDGKIYDKLFRSSIAENKKLHIFITMMRYELLLNSKNHQLGINYDRYKIKFFDIELFASPINRTLPEFCSAYPDIDKYHKGNLGSMFEFSFQSGKKYTMNPPYIEYLMTRAVKHLLSEFDRNDVSDVEVFITIPIWDRKILKELSSRKGEILQENVPDVPYIPYELLKNSKYLVKIETFDINDYEYFDHNKQKKISVANTFHIVLKKEK